MFEKLAEAARNYVITEWATYRALKQEVPEDPTRRIYADVSTGDRIFADIHFEGKTGPWTYHTNVGDPVSKIVIDEKSSIGKGVTLTHDSCDPQLAELLTTYFDKTAAELRAMYLSSRNE